LWRTHLDSSLENIVRLICQLPLLLPFFASLADTTELVSVAQSVNHLLCDKTPGSFLPRSPVRPSGLAEYFLSGSAKVEYFVGQKEFSQAAHVLLGFLLVELNAMMDGYLLSYRNWLLSTVSRRYLSV
jgi:hypothetical protein